MGIVRLLLEVLSNGNIKGGYIRFLIFNLGLNEKLKFLFQNSAQPNLPLY